MTANNANAIPKRHSSLHEHRTTPKINNARRLTSSQERLTSYQLQDGLPLPSPTPPVIDEDRSFTYGNCLNYKAIKHSDSVLKMFDTMRKREELCDVTLAAGDREFKCHRALLSASSPYFNSMFAGVMRESNQQKITMHDVNDTALEHIIDFFYTASLMLSMDNVAFILPLACMLQVDNVAEACCTFMKRNVNIANCLGVASFADMHGCAELKSFAEDYAVDHFAEVVQADEFLHQPLSLLVRLISSDSLNVCSEERVYEAVMAWIKHDLDNRQQHTYELLKLVRLAQMSADFLMSRVRGEDVVMNSKPVINLLFEAVQYHLKTETRPSPQTSYMLQPRKPISKYQVMVAVGGMGRREPTATVERYNPSSKKWASLAPMATCRWGTDCAGLDGHIYVVGGSDDTSRLNSVERYDFVRDQWSAVPPMSTARNGVGVTTVNGYLFAIGGFDGSTPLRSGEQYSPRKGKWTPISDMRYRRFGVGVCSYDGMIYAIGGSDGTNLNTAECYNTQTGQWSMIAPMSTCRKHPGVAAIGGKIYAVGGCDTSTTRLNSVECYDPTNDQWTTVAPMRLCRSGLGVSAFDGFLYVVGGYDGGNYLSSCERYDPLSDEWTDVPSMQKSRDCVGLTVITLHGKQLQPSSGSSANSSPECCSPEHRRQHSS